MREYKQTCYGDQGTTLEQSVLGTSLSDKSTERLVEIGAKMTYLEVGFEEDVPQGGDV